MITDDSSVFMAGDAEEQLSRLEDGSVHCIITSPPYWTQRDYGTDGQLGTEACVTAYVENLVSVFEECHRVLRDDGSLLLNLGDTYTNKSKNQIPARVVLQLQEGVGFKLRQDNIWEKSHSKPDPATDRRATEHEYVFHLTKQGQYWYDGSVTGGDHTSVIEAPTASTEHDHLAVYSEELVAKLMEGVVPPKVCNQCGTPYTRTYERVPRPFCDPERTQAQRAAELYEDSDLTEKHVEAVQSCGISDVGKAVETEDGAGRNSDSVERLAGEAKEVLGGYYREFTMVEKHPVGWESECSCNSTAVGGVVCDPFVGSGTTAAVAEQHGYRCIGIDINESYLQTARERVNG